MSELIFEGKITEVRTPRTGTTAKGEWANTEFEVTEAHPQNPEYPQVGLFEFFKNGEHVKFAKDFANMYPLGTDVKVHFNLKKNEYTKANGEIAKFYKTSAWKVGKSESSAPPVPPAQAFEPATDIKANEHDDLPF
ncbi:hypothetical protein Harreka1_25 [Olleya phage Harreka_1]|uniref:DUF3127 domain-containing protein n=1 Tax=Olleya phage Harreka_1 TaxID=2745673 RepID=A0A8E5EBI0_9CAUD|nr:single strand DNA binding protein [Olleya phage Harreka_1]QQV90432.1 hypothetical protein Harreka1_25 [Olleya phage Harreka_1]